MSADTDTPSSRTAQHDRDEDGPLGSKKRDFMVLYRVIIAVLSFASAMGVSVILYAGGKYVETAAKEAASEAVAPFTELPYRLTRLEEYLAPLAGAESRIKLLEVSSGDRAMALKEIAIWRATQDLQMQRLFFLLDNQQKQADRQQIQMERQQSAIDQLARRQ